MLQFICSTANTVLKPFGLVLWISYECEDDKDGNPIYSTMKARGFQIGKCNF